MTDFALPYALLRAIIHKFMNCFCHFILLTRGYLISVFSLVMNENYAADNLQNSTQNISNSKGPGWWWW